VLRAPRSEDASSIPFDWRVDSVLAAEGDLFVLWGSAFEGAGDETSQITRTTMAGSPVWTSQASNFREAVGRGVVLSEGTSIHTGCSGLRAFPREDGSPPWDGRFSSRTWRSSTDGRHSWWISSSTAVNVCRRTPGGRTGGREAPAPERHAARDRYAGALSKNAAQSACLLAPLPWMNSSTMSCAASSLNCTGGLFMK
jgi:hypothetical protein